MSHGGGCFMVEMLLLGVAYAQIGGRTVREVADFNGDLKTVLDECW